MLKQRKRWFEVLVYAISTIGFIAVSYFLILQITKEIKIIPFCLLEFSVLMFFLIASSSIIKAVTKAMEEKVLKKEETKYLQLFIDSLRFCYTLEDFYEIIQRILEQKADCSVLYMDSEKEYVLYNSPNRITNDKDVLRTLMNNFPATWPDGFDFVGDKLGITSRYKKARGFVISHEKFHFFVLCRYTRFFDTGIYNTLVEEFYRFRKRTQTIASLSEIAGLSKEWEQLAETQRLFLPEVMPDTKRLKIAAYFRPLVNVSGDYYTALPIDEHKTLLMLGDVSGKGLPAALIMGLVMNTVKIIEDKEDLIGIVRAIDKAIKGMKLQDKYTVLFISVVDTQKMTIRYVNASMSDPLIVTRAPDGYTIKPLSSNCGVVGIIDIDDIRIDEQRLFRDDLILFASDGVSEVMNDEGVELGDTDLYTETIKNSAAKQPQEFIDDIVNLIFDYKGNNKLHDDITMMVTKVVS
ncbi:MAG: SpoIIE family protein phosphatase [Treponema sp.]|uniref:PP2C family protein-serine/threonine phosphatase n=1 Tax=Treponema sp. TaxID=166 RepID=UPI001D98C931|nr:SpoIIE family protein phosphatase [Treponema sp.]MBS7310251.1 SpoIIE family protein phosphatase [Treponema sp.]MCI5696149.1 SpoIIE family protein phosphatase [Spirochaetia bacterium]MDY5885959.1 SpoIIE family protein phosphatase [Treponema sp.]